MVSDSLLFKSSIGKGKSKKMRWHRGKVLVLTQLARSPCGPAWAQQWPTPAAPGTRTSGRRGPRGRALGRSSRGGLGVAAGGHPSRAWRGHWRRMPPRREAAKAGSGGAWRLRRLPHIDLRPLDPGRALPNPSPPRPRLMVEGFSSYHPKTPQKTPTNTSFMIKCNHGNRHLERGRWPESPLVVGPSPSLTPPSAGYSRWWTSPSVLFYTVNNVSGNSRIIWRFFP